LFLPGRNKRYKSKRATIPLVQTVLDRVKTFPLGQLEVLDEVKNELQATLKAISVPRQKTEPAADSDSGLVPPDEPSSLQSTQNGRRALDDTSLVKIGWQSA